MKFGSIFLGMNGQRASDGFSSYGFGAVEMYKVGLIAISYTILCKICV